MNEVTTPISTSLVDLLARAVSSAREYAELDPPTYALIVAAEAVLKALRGSDPPPSDQKQEAP